MRITTNGVLRNYQRHLGKSSSNLDSARLKALTTRSYQKASENPAAAAKSYKLRRDYLENENYLNNVDDAIGKFDVMEQSMLSVEKMAITAYENLLEAKNGTKTLEDRKIFAESLRSMQETIINDMNISYNGDFVFAGKGTREVPFKYSYDPSTAPPTHDVTYRGENVDSLTNTHKLITEKVYSDLGFGLKFDAAGQIVESSAFNVSVSGADFLGYGVNGDGIPKNLVSLLGVMADEIEKEPLDDDKITKLADQLMDTKASILASVTNLGTKGNFLQTTKSRLEDIKLNLNEKIDKTEYVNIPEAITDYSWAQFAYNAAQKIGVNILSQSFIDFMR